MHLSAIFVFLRKNNYLCSKLINLLSMAKKNEGKKPSSLDDLALQEFFKKVDDVERESRESDIGVVDDMYRYNGENEQQPAAAPEGEATGDGKPAGEPVPEPPQGGPGGEASGGRPSGRRHSARMPKVAASEDAAPRLNLIGADVPRIKLLLYMLKMKNVKGSNAKIILDYLERGVRKDYPDLVKMVDTLMGSQGEAKE